MLLLGDPGVSWTSTPWIFFFVFLFCFKEIEPPAATCSCLAHFYGGPGINFGGQIQVLRPTAVSSQEARPLPTVLREVPNLLWGLGPHVALESRIGKKAGSWRKVGKAKAETQPSSTFLQGIVVPLTNLLLVPITVWGAFCLL